MANMQMVKPLASLLVTLCGDLSSHCVFLRRSSFVCFRVGGWPCRLVDS
jgi:hypothetical protein